MRPVLPLLLIAFLAVPAAYCGAEKLESVRASDRASFLENRSQARSSRLFMPIALDDPASGVLSLYALRNVSNATLTVSSLFIMADGDLLFREDVLGPEDTITINVRDLGLPVDPDLEVSLATVDFAVVDPNTGQPIDDRSLVGDWFLVDPGSNLSVGDPLIGGGQLCDTFNTRFALGGGVFDGSDFVIAVPDFDPATDPPQSISGRVYDENGQLFDTFNLTTTKVVTVLDNVFLSNGGVTLPNFGSIEWSIGNGRVGLMTWSMNAEGRFSVGMSASCIE
jgi:hypothetical protein